MVFSTKAVLRDIGGDGCIHYLVYFITTINYYHEINAIFYGAEKSNISYLYGGEMIRFLISITIFTAFFSIAMAQYLEPFVEKKTVNCMALISTSEAIHFSQKALLILSEVNNLCQSNQRSKAQQYGLSELEKLANSPTAKSMESCGSHFIDTFSISSEREDIHICDSIQPIMNAP
jgi:hypothetical protein